MLGATPTPAAWPPCASALLDGLTPERMQALGAKLYDLALAGDLAAAKLLLTYAIGKPPDAVDADRLDLDEWRILDAVPTLAQFLRLSADGIDPQDAAALIGKLRPQDEAKAGERVLAAVTGMDEAADLGEPWQWENSSPGNGRHASANENGTGRLKLGSVSVPQVLGPEPVAVRG